MAMRDEETTPQLADSNSAPQEPEAEAEPKQAYIVELQVVQLTIKLLADTPLTYPTSQERDQLVQYYGRLQPQIIEASSNGGSRTS